ncbi:MAG: exodeoxyribonuclease VII large subunit [Verrucomicrobia bacterium]|nr:exodeoxyribonuclease VII large subunit [Verrucomicrobiota bacterium]
MNKNAKSQWDFGDELFPREEMRRVLSVSEITSQVRRLLEQHVGTIWITGEITNLRAQSSGHLYFSLKDAFAQLNCVLFKSEQVGDRSALRDGQKVILRGEMTVYEARGQYQLRVTAVELQGIGALQIAFEKLKQKLQAEGLFSTDRKRPLPRFPQRIGVVTSPTGAAIHDVLRVIERRNPSLEIIFVPCSVQGQPAASEIASSIRLLNRFAETNHLDLILVTRGGGSLEDLWAFNEEVVARAIFHSQIPVVSAVGHEIDFTISDFVADLRAATPSAAAEIITEGVFSSYRFISEAGVWLRQRVRQRLDRERRNVTQVQQRLNRVHPRLWLNEKLQHLDDLHLNLHRCVKHDLHKKLVGWKNLQERLSRVHPQRILKLRRDVLFSETERLREQMHHRLEKLRHRLERVETRLKLLSPAHVLARGYSITRDPLTGKIVRSAKDVQTGQQIVTTLQQGEITSTIDDKSEA